MSNDIEKQARERTEKKAMENLDDFRKKYGNIYDAIFNKGRVSGIETGQNIAKSKKGADHNTDENLSLEQKAKAAWDKDPNLRFEFVDSFDIFLAFVKADDGGRAKIVGGISQGGAKDIQAAINSTDENLPIEDRANAAWDKDPDLRFEFMDNFDIYLAFAKADEAGRAKIASSISQDGSKKEKQADVEVLSGDDSNLPLEDRAKATWDKDPDLRAEFVDNFDAFLAFATADQAGRTKIIGGSQRRAGK